MINQTILTRSGLRLLVEFPPAGGRSAVRIQAPVGTVCRLHWGLRHPTQTGWTLPPQTQWPPGTRLVGSAALQTPFSTQNSGPEVRIPLGPLPSSESLAFVLFFPDEGRWDNNGGHNYEIPLSAPGDSPANPLAALPALGADSAPVFQRAFDLGGGLRLAVGVTQQADRFRVTFCSDLTGGLLLHWGVAQRSPLEWLLPPASVHPPGSSVFQELALQTPFTPRENFNWLRLEFPEAEAPLGLPFVLRSLAQGGRWLNCAGANFYVPIRAVETGASQANLGPLTALADEMVRAETTHQSWTLMHRFNLCHDLLERLRQLPGGLALAFVWLRFSALRQLTWQRRYNTKPRELAHSQDRLTQKLAALYRTEPPARPWVRLALATLGRGGEGQRIRDEILHIMHRHQVKEVSGHFLEEWHQKLHNNTTPDDIVICQAYLEFLRTDGNRERFYQVLLEGGVTRQRLESFERPIRTPPDFVPHLKSGLLGDFQHFLGILKASHSGTDLETAIQQARGHLDPGFQGLLGYVWEHRNDPPEGLVNLVNRLTDARRRLAGLLPQTGPVRELLYLDLALEQLLRTAIERSLHFPLTGDHWADLIAQVLDHVSLSHDDPELAACARHWQRLQAQPRFGPDWSLHAKSVLDRVARALTAWTDRLHQLLQPQAEYLGRGFQAEPWTITLFSEEVVRGGSLAFVLSILLHHLEPLLRQAAHLGRWQILSRGQGAGRIEVVPALAAIQRRAFAHPTVVIADQVRGDEEIPDGVTAVLAPDVTDIVSHVAVRARNANILFAACHDPELLRHLKSLQGHTVRLEVNLAGDVTVEETTLTPPPPPPPRRVSSPAQAPPAFTRCAIPLAEFTRGNVGAKSLHQALLRGQLPDWIHLPAAVAVPFGVFEHTLDLESNREVAQRYRQGLPQTESLSHEALVHLRQTVLTLSEPPDLREALRLAMGQAGVPWSDPWESAWQAIKRVWASQWNERAFLSRRKMGLPHEQLRMAVLIQPVVPADYAFVIHTVNPATGRPNELLAEVVLGLGETLVGNFPGRALTFVFDKTTGQSRLLSYPAKSHGLYGGGLIFRSDSNGEDLAGYAGAGLYDSILLQEPRSLLLDYSAEPLLWDEPFRQGLLTAVGRVGLAVEQARGSPQDIEGAVAHGQFHVVQTRPQVGLT